MRFVPFLPQYVLILCNTIGTPLDSKYIDIGESARLNILHLSTTLHLAPWYHHALKVHSAVK